MPASGFDLTGAWSPTAGSRSARRLRFANWRVCMIQCAGSQKMKAMIACTGLGRAAA
jgi:hypothetical protein